MSHGVGIGHFTTVACMLYKIKRFFSKRAPTNLLIKLDTFLKLYVFVNGTDKQFKTHLKLK